MEKDRGKQRHDSYHKLLNRYFIEGQGFPNILFT